MIESRIGRCRKRYKEYDSIMIPAIMWNKKLHVDEFEVVDSVDSSTSLCLYIM